MSATKSIPPLDDEQGSHEGTGRRTRLADGRERQPTLISAPVVETDFAELEDGSLLETIEDPSNSSRSLLAVYKDGEVRFTDRLQSGARVLVPIPRDRHVIKHVRLARGTKPYKSARWLLREIDLIISRCLDLDECSTTLLANFVLSTWFIDRLPVAPYLSFVGLPRSGKSTALSILRLLCRRSLLTADITSAAFYRVCEDLTPTLLIDETSTAGANRILFHLLRTGTTRDAVALRKNESFKTFGAKVISWTELPNDAALNSRCILIPLQETHRTDLAKPSDPEIVHAADDLQEQLLQFRFEKFKTLNPSTIPGDEQLHSRTRDLYTALALPVGEDTDACKFLVACFRVQQVSNREPLSPRQTAVLQYLFYVIHHPDAKGDYGIGQLTTGVNSLLVTQDERFRMSPREVGAVLTSLGLTKRQRTNTGWYVWLDRQAQKQIHELATAYGFDRCAGAPTEKAIESCALCQNREA